MILWWVRCATIVRNQHRENTRRTHIVMNCPIQKFCPDLSWRIAPPLAPPRGVGTQGHLRNHKEVSVGYTKVREDGPHFLLDFRGFLTKFLLKIFESLGWLKKLRTCALYCKIVVMLKVHICTTLHKHVFRSQATEHENIFRQCCFIFSNTADFSSSRISYLEIPSKDEERSNRNVLVCTLVMIPEVASEDKNSVVWFSSFAWSRAWSCRSHSLTIVRACLCSGDPRGTARSIDGPEYINLTINL